jgi:DNA-binding NarL/FixJ family response regulator
VPIRVFLADDDSSYRFLLRETLPASGIEVVGEAAEPEAVVDGVARAAPDVVLLDRFCEARTVEEMRAAVPGVRVIILSGYQPGDGDQALVAAADGYVVKGADLDELRAAVRG